MSLEGREWLRAMLHDGVRDETDGALKQLIKVGMLRRVDAQTVQLNAKGRRVMEKRRNDPDSQRVVQIVLLSIASPLIDQQNIEGLKQLQPHLRVVTYQAMPRADQAAVVLAMSFLLSLVHTRDFDQACTFAKDVFALEQATGQTIVPEKIREDIARGRCAPHLTLAMKYILQSAVFLAPHAPVPLAVLHTVFEPQADAERAIQQVVAIGFLQQPDPHTVVPTDEGTKLLEPPDDELREGILAAILKIASQANKVGDEATLRQVEPHLRALVNDAVPRADNAAYRLTTALAVCLAHLKDFGGSIEYMDAAEEIAAALGKSDAEEEIAADDEGALNYRGQAGAHYYVKKDYARARKHFEQAISATSDAENLAHLFKMLGECSGALNDPVAELSAYITALKKAIECYGLDSWQLARHRSDLALALIRHGQIEAAARHLNAALARCDATVLDDPHFYMDTAKVVLPLAEIHYRQGEKSAARQTVERFVGLAGRMGDRWRDRVSMLYSASSLMHHNGDLDLALAPLNEALGICETKLDLTESQARSICEQLRSLHKLHLWRHA